MDDLLKISEQKMKSSIDHLHTELGKVRTGRASVSLVEDIKVDYYGNPTPLPQTSTLGVPDSKTITIAPWDATLVPVIEKAIQASDLGLTPSNDGKVIRLTIPPLTTERRQQLTKVVKKYGEDCKVAIRNIRRDFNDKLKAMEKDHSISKDEERKGHDQIQKITDKYAAEVDSIVQSKEKDVMEG
ncbi:MAG: ribosome recycling factor [Nitrospinaceae bacterium]|nr:ribosome recycling factor [Nitrospinaceae bacterium]NIR54924.1 ribosome recycling factor [Nitrospinaceae bacterium]NIS85352.1 ribosome recycling factor [Nitrospinaceae bacterium]NIT82166.1 ribosome recycling factor [Nitrospinaceae bacterium]NIU44420.1 ribosome recycling factor [Nitrospinaceae bacterium]